MDFQKVPLSFCFRLCKTDSDPFPAGPLRGFRGPLMPCKSPEHRDRGPAPVLPLRPCGCALSGSPLSPLSLQLCFLVSTPLPPPPWPPRREGALTGPPTGPLSSSAPHSFHCSSTSAASPVVVGGGERRGLEACCLFLLGERHRAEEKWGWVCPHTEDRSGGGIHGEDRNRGRVSTTSLGMGSETRGWNLGKKEPRGGAERH